MRSKVFLPDNRCLHLDCMVVDDEHSLVEVVVHSACETAECPCCGQISSRIHSGYQRRLTDLPWQGLRVILFWRSRKFYCRKQDCSRKVFTERLPQVAASYGRRTERLGIALRCIAFALGGEGGARLTERLGMSVSSDLLLREIRRTSIPQIQVPRVLGVDDWAYRKGQRYGTVLVDLERGRPVEILPDREPETLKTWLQNNPGVEIISRDRGDCYIKGATEGAPNAIQVADRFHLVKNLREALERLVGRHSQSVRSAFEQLRKDQPVPASVKQDTHLEADRLRPLEPTLADLKRQQLHDEVMSLWQQSVSMREISRRSVSPERDRR